MTAIEHLLFTNAHKKDIVALSNYQKGVQLMKKLVLFLVLLLGVSTTAVAQDIAVADLFFGYSFYRCFAEAREYVAGDAIPTDYYATPCQLNGWNAALDFNMNSKWAVTVDASGYYGWHDNWPVRYAPTNVTGEAAHWRIREVIEQADVKYFNLMGGPKYTFGSSETVRPYVHALFGVSHVNTPPQVVVENRFMQAYGGGVDVKLSDKWSVRPIQADYLRVRRYSTYENNFRFSAGFIYKIGEKY